MTNELFSYELIEKREHEFDFSRGYGVEWEIALPLNDIEIADGEYDPLLNFLYPLGEYFEVPSDFREKLDNMTIVKAEDQYWLALTAAGMDLTWEICRTYINLGYYPPVAFCRLPAMSGRGSSPGDLEIIRRCNESLKAMIECIQSRITTNEALLPPSAQTANSGTHEKRQPKRRLDPCQKSSPLSTPC
jgi:hypothetical protein